MDDANMLTKDRNLWKVILFLFYFSAYFKHIFKKLKNENCFSVHTNL